MQQGMKIKAVSVTLLYADRMKTQANIAVPFFFNNMKPRRTLTKVQTLYTHVSLKREVISSMLPR